jgi:hypothetical protein
MFKKILRIYIVSSLIPIWLITGLSYIIYPHIWAVIAIGLLILISFIFLGFAFHYSLAQVIEQLEDILSSIRIEAVASSLPTSEPVFEIEREEDEV